MRLERLYPGPTESIDGDDRDALLELYRPPSARWLRLNLITSVTGAASGTDGTSETLTNPVDRRILGVIRELADVVLIGAQTLRAESYLQPRRSRLAVVTSSGDLGGHRIEATDGVAPIVICPESAVATAKESLPLAEYLVVGVSTSSTKDGGSTAGIAPADIIQALRDNGQQSIVCEGGPSLAAQLVDAGLVDEFCLSTAARIGGAPFPVLGSSAIAERDVVLSQLLRDEASSLYARWALQASS